MNQPKNRRFAFGPFVLDAGERVLWREGRPVTLRAKVFDTLLVLVKNGGRALGKDELMCAIWPDTYVEEGNLAQNISRLRKVLGDQEDGDAPYIETLPGRGYRFVAEVREAEETDLLLRRRTRTHVITTTREESEDAAQQSARSAEAATDDAHAPLTSTGAPPVPVKQTDASLVAPWATVARLEGRSSSNPRRIAVKVGALVLLCACLAAGVWYLRNARVRRDPPRASELRSLAVLPFQPIGGDAPDDEYMGIGMADTLITRFGNVSQVVVRPTSAVRKFAVVDRDSIAAGRQLGVEAVLDGSLQRAGDCLRVNVRLLRVADGSVLWGESFDAKNTDIFSVEDSISSQIVRALSLRLSSEERARAERRFTENADAYEAYLKGLYFFNRQSEADAYRAIAGFEEAARLDPNYALAYSGLTNAYLQLFSYGKQRETEDKIKPNLAKALALGESSADVQLSLARTRELLDWDYAGAEQAYRRALELNPNHSLVLSRYAVLLAVLERYDEALDTSRRALELDPLSLSVIRNDGIILMAAGQNERGLAQLRRLTELDPTFSRGHFSLGIGYCQVGRYDEAIAEFETYLSQSKEGKAYSPLLGFAYAKSGRTEQAQSVLAEMLKQERRGEVGSYELAVVYSGLGDADQAFARLEKAYREHDQQFFGFKMDPWFRDLRSDPRFVDLASRIGLKTGSVAKNISGRRTA